MQADQASGLRGKYLRRVAQVVSLFAVQPTLAARLARAIQARGPRLLLIDTTGRHALASKTQSIFGWEQQVARQRILPVSVDGIDWFQAPGAQAGDAALAQANPDYDYVLFDADSVPPGTLALDLHTAQTLLVEMIAAPEALCNAYALIKTLHANPLHVRVILCGEASVCERVISATQHFLQARPAWLGTACIEGDAHLAALAARISAAEITTSQFYNNTGGEFAQHG